MIFRMSALSEVRTKLLRGQVIPAHPLALTEDRSLDERHQRALTRYYLAAGAGGLAVGVHTTQFEIHEPEVGLYRPVLELAKEEAERSEHDPVMIAGLVGTTGQAREEALRARELGYDCGLLSLAALPEASVKELVEHVTAVAEVLPVFGFYLQTAVGGLRLSYQFWRRFCEIDDAVAIKIAPFDRYQTLDVVRAVADAGRLDEIALYTGNDDHIVGDLLMEFPFDGARIAGGLLGQWAVWTRTAVRLLEEIKRVRRNDEMAVPATLLRRGAEITDANAALFDPEHDFAGSIAGIHEVLRRQGLLRGRWTLNPDEQLSPGQVEEIDRVYAAYPHLNDDDFVRAHLDDWLS